MVWRRRFADRRAAGRELAEALVARALPRPIVLALPRGGVAVAVEVAKALAAPLDLVMVRKLGAPGHEELAAGAVVDGEHPETVLNEDVVDAHGITESYLARTRARELAEIERRRRLYLGDRQPLPVAGRSAIVVDDGIATGATMRAALLAVRRRGPARLVLAVPVAPPTSLAELAPLADETVCLAPEPDLMAVGQFYEDFGQIEDDEVGTLLAEVPAPAADEGGR
jgi:putative phosphoribosyl transferase